MCLATMHSFAAPLNGGYTINQSAGASATNYISFNAFATDLNTNGVSGPVTVTVMNGPYNEQVTFNQFTGGSAINRVVIYGNNQVLTFNANSGAPWTMRLNGADFMTIQDLQMSGTNTSYAFVGLITNAANYNTFSNCTFSCNANITSSYAIPFMWSASSTAPSTGSSSGDYNTVVNCQMFSGYYGVMMYGLTGAPYNVGNTLKGCKVQDFYYIGIYCYYHWNSSVMQNTIERPTRTTLYYFYGIYAYYCFGTKVDGNILQNPWGTSPTQSSYYAYGIYAYGYANPVPAGASKIVLQNNILRNWQSNYYFYGIYSYYWVDIIHNTISFDNSSSTNSSTIYGMYFYTQSGNENNVRNNLISITMGGSGPKYALYNGTGGSLTTINGNNIWV
jgi:hypothetical protein